ncbi:MAG: hypothetical protein AABY11_02980, partial [archaeon]
IHDQQAKIESILPILKQKQKFSHEREDAEIHEGKAAIRSLYDGLINEMGKGDYYYAFALKNIYEFSDFAQLFFRQKHQLLIAKGVDDRIIARFDVKEDFMRIFGDIRGMQYRFVKEDFPVGLAITKGRVLNTMWGSTPCVFEIRSKLLAEQYKNFFLSVWNGAKLSPNTRAFLPPK